jgi:hypothetical protein
VLPARLHHAHARIAEGGTSARRKSGRGTKSASKTAMSSPRARRSRGERSGLEARRGATRAAPGRNAARAQLATPRRRSRGLVAESSSTWISSDRADSRAADGGDERAATVRSL